MNNAKSHSKLIKNTKTITGSLLAVFLSINIYVFGYNKTAFAGEINDSEKTPEVVLPDNDSSNIDSSETGSSPLTPGETPEQTPDETPESTPEQTPEATPEQTPESTPDQTPEQTPEPTAKPTEPIRQAKRAHILVGEKPMIDGKTGETILVEIPLINVGSGYAYDVSATLKIDSKEDTFPFRVEKTVYNASLTNKFASISELIDKDSFTNISAASRNLKFGNLKIKEDLVSGYYRVNFEITYSDENDSGKTAERYFFVKITNPDKPDPNMKEPDPDPDNSFDPGLISDGGFTGGISGFEEENRSIPRVMSTGFTTSPENVIGGTEFTAKIKLKNTSKTSDVKNIRVTLSSFGEDAAVFMPASGASTIYIEKIEKDTEIEQEVKLKTNATVEQKAYSLELKFEYEDEKGNPYSAEESISIMVYQELRFDLGKIEIMPDTLVVGDDANIMFSVFNKGKATLYNLTIVIPEGCLEKNEIFIGNLESGNSKDVDFMVKAGQANWGDEIPFQITFEDAVGKVTTVDKTLALTINEGGDYIEEFPGGEFPGEEFPIDDPDMMGEKSAKLPWWGWVGIGVGGLILIGIIIKIVRIRKAKKEQAEIDEMV
ncbi:MAG TPA: hypothetical protein GXZ43_01830 [Clostridiaceae bacterium]|mgnify:CR=1 FL=1|nr:hypothetical protein [Clostridiaceae bacterium]